CSQRVMLPWLATVCGSAADSTAVTPRPLVFERWSPAQPSSYDVLVAASGSIVLMSNRISRDGRATRAPPDPRVRQLARVEIDGTTALLYSTELGLVRWDLTTDA